MSLSKKVWYKCNYFVCGHQFLVFNVDCLPVTYIYINFHLKNPTPKKKDIFIVSFFFTDVSLLCWGKCFLACCIWHISKQYMNSLVRVFIFYFLFFIFYFYFLFFIFYFLFFIFYFFIVIPFIFFVLFFCCVCSVGRCLLFSL